jgi:hypothetical protein
MSIPVLAFRDRQDRPQDATVADETIRIGFTLQQLSQDLVRQMEFVPRAQARGACASLYMLERVRLESDPLKMGGRHA